MRFYYTVLLYLLAPFIFLRLLLRSIRQPAYRKRLAERLGFVPFKRDKCIWVHAVSVGETMAAIPLVKRLQQLYPNLPIVMTSMTPTGAERVAVAFAGSGSVVHAYLPYDFPFAVSRFIKRINPRIAIIMETEWWPNLLASLRKQSIPVCLLNARLSERSYRAYQRIASLSRNMLASVTVIAANSVQDAERFKKLGAQSQQITVTGNIKFDLQLPKELSEQAAALHLALGGQGRKIWMAASTHAGEEEQILAAHQQIQRIHPKTLLILVPRHPDRFNQVFKLCSQKFATKRRSLAENCHAETAVYLADTMGELLLFYAVADLAFIGGSLVPVGGHNMLEAAVLAKPILSGMHLINFQEISQMLLDAGAMILVQNSVDLANKVIDLLNHPDRMQSMGDQASNVVLKNQGALARQIALVKQCLVDAF